MGGTFGNIRALLQDGSNRPSLAVTAAAGAITGFTQSLVVAPGDQLKIFLQSKNLELTNDLSPTSLRDSVRKTWMLTAEEQAVRGVVTPTGKWLAFMRCLYFGLPVTWMREVPSSAVYFSAYEFLRRKQTHHIPPGLASTLSIPLIGGLTGMLTWTLSFPIDNVKSHIQHARATGERLGTIEVMKEMYAENGIKRFYSGGFVPAVMRSVPVHMAVFATFEASMSMINKVCPDV